MENKDFCGKELFAVKNVGNVKKHILWHYIYNCIMYTGWVFFHVTISTRSHTIMCKHIFEYLHPNNGDGLFLWNIGNHLQDHTVLRAKYHHQQINIHLVLKFFNVHFSFGIKAEEEQCLSTGRTFIFMFI